MSKPGSSEFELEQMAELLQLASHSLGQAAELIKLSPLDRQPAFDRLSHAIADILAVEMQIYERRPDLTPEHLRPGWAEPQQ